MSIYVTQQVLVYIGYSVNVTDTSKIEHRLRGVWLEIDRVYVCKTRGYAIYGSLVLG
jgi:hypothetical protein